MKRTFCWIILLSFYILIFSASIYAKYNSSNSNSILSSVGLCYGNFFMQYKWFYVDSFICPYGYSTTSIGVGSYIIEVSNSYFQEFNYEPKNYFSLLSFLHKQNNFSIYKEEKVVFKVKHNDVYNNHPDDGYPKLILTFPDNSIQTYTMTNNASNYDIYTYSLSLDKGTYRYKYLTTDKNHSKGFCEISGEWHVTTRPYNFVKKTPNSSAEAEIVPNNVYFSWSINTDEVNDELFYELHIGCVPIKKNLTKIENGPNANALSFTISKLEHKRQYYWYMIVKNKFGVSMETDLFSFKTGGFVGKFYNAPNPFNPVKHMNTDFVFHMRYNGNAQITIYSEYGDKVWESDEMFFTGDNSQAIRYDGRDNFGKILYNGTYLAVLKKKYADNTEMERCRLLIIK